MTSLATAILRTLKYSDHFGFPLTLKEIHLRLYSSEPCSLERVFGTLKSMLKKDTIFRTGDYYHLPGRSSLVARRHKRTQLSSPHLVRAKSLSGRLARIPGVYAIYLTGSLAMHNSSQSSDIDFMIITRPGRLWTTRLLLTLYTSILGLRRTPHSKHNTGKLCLNLYLSPSSYLLPPDRRSLYTAYELIQAIPLHDPHNTRSALLFANSWISSYLPNFPLPKRTLLNRNSRLQVEKGPAAAGRRVFMVIESLSYRLQLSYMRPKITREYITLNSAFFHPKDPAPKV